VSDAASPGISAHFGENEMKETGIERVDTQQRAEQIAADERKRVIAKSAEVIEAFACGIDRKQPAPDQR